MTQQLTGEAIADRFAMLVLRVLLKGFFAGSAEEGLAADLADNVLGRLVLSGLSRRFSIDGVEK